MKHVKMSIVLGCGALILTLGSLGPVFASVTKNTTSTTTAKPADLVDAKDLAGMLLPEGKKIELVGTLGKADQRFLLTSKETKKSYRILENSLLASMLDTAGQHPAQLFRTVARVTVFRGENYIFITKVTLAQ